MWAGARISARSYRLAALFPERTARPIAGVGQKRARHRCFDFLSASDLGTSRCGCACFGGWGVRGKSVVFVHPKEAWIRSALAALLLGCLLLWGAGFRLMVGERPDRSLTVAARLAGLFAAGLALAVAAGAIASPRR